MYKFIEKSENNYISLHDCRATRVAYEGEYLSFVFKDGFWVGEKNSQNPYGKIVSTDQAEVEFHILDEDVTVYVFTEKKNHTIRKEWTIQDLMKKINNGTCQLEFLYQYKGYQSVIYECELWSKQKPYHKECVLMFRTDENVYKWNEFLAERE